MWSDASPVAGTDLQGQVLLIVLASGLTINRVLPGVCLAYGFGRVIDKAIALLHALFLICGPDKLVLEYVLASIRSVTTDLGTEIDIPDIPDILDPFLKVMAGSPIESFVGMVDRTSRLLPSALKIAGWSHMMSNLVKHACFSVSNWPALLKGMRTVCNFLKKEDWRKHIVKALRSQVPGIGKLLAHWSANFAKWRYETIHDCLEAMVKVRDLCQGYLIDSVKIFGTNFQEVPFLRDFVAACRWHHLWEFASAFFCYVCTPLERARRWGLACSCCTAVAG